MMCSYPMLSKSIDFNSSAGSVFHPCDVFHPKVVNMLSELNFYQGCFRKYVSPLVEFENL